MIRMTSLHLICAMAFGLWNTPAWQTPLCADKALQATADAQLKKAEELERAGQPREAMPPPRKRTATASATRNGMTPCSNAPPKPSAWKTKRSRICRTRLSGMFARQAVADAGRMQRKLVDTKPDDINTVSHAIDYFSQQNDKAQEQAMRGHA